MRVMVLVKATDDSEKGILPTTEMFEAMGRYNEELVQAGIMRMADGLKPPRRASVLRSMVPAVRSSTGLSPETRELVAGFWLWEVKEWTRRSPG